MGELFAEIGDLVFTVVIGYISAIEILYVVRHLIHYTCNHDATDGSDSNENVLQLQDSMRKQLDSAKNKEASAGTQVMKDGVLYKEGFRLEAQQTLVEQLKEQLNDKELSDLRRQELEKEFAKQAKIAEKLRKELIEAEAMYQRQLIQKETKAKNLLEEQSQREQEERTQIEDEAQACKLVEAEKQREAKQRKLEEEQKYREAEEQAHKLAETEKRREAEQRQREEDAENGSRLLELEKRKEYEQRILEERERAETLKEKTRKQHEIVEPQETPRHLFEKENANEENQALENVAADLAAETLLAIEHQLEEQLRAVEKEAELTEKERQLIDSIKKRDLSENKGHQHKEADLFRKILEAREQLGEESEEEQSFRLMQHEKDQEAKQKRIEENALLFLEAEKEMAELQSKMLDAVENKVFRGGLESSPQTPIVEQPCIKRSYSPLSGGESSHSTVKTQLAQDSDDLFSVRTKQFMFPGVSDDTSSIDPASSQQSSFSTQHSEDVTTGTDYQYTHQERQEPDGEDNNLIQHQYSDDYLRSLDGIKQRPLVREDGSGRRRAFKKRRSSNSSNSSRESRQSRDEELKMFTSLEEEEMKDTADSEFTPIRYNTEPALKVKGHNRRHKRSPAKDMKRSDDSLRSSLERLGEETSDPWGEVKPEQYKHTEFWKREKTLSIDEENEFEKPTSSEEVPHDTATNLPSASSFEEATQKQNHEALSALQKHSAQKDVQEGITSEQANIEENSARNDNTNLQTPKTRENEAPSVQSVTLPHLTKLTAQKEEPQQSVLSSAQNTPTINIYTPLDVGPWRDEYGLMMEGLSDFYDFTASVNPSRSRSASRNVSPANTSPNTPLPKDVSFQLKLSNDKVNENPTVEIFDDTEDLPANTFKKDNIIKFIGTLTGKESHIEQNRKYDSEPIEADIKINQYLKNVADDPTLTSKEASLVPLVNVIEDITITEDTNFADGESSDMAINTLVSSLRSQQSNRSRSRSKSPLPTPDNLKRSVENRRYKMIKHNEDILEKLIETKLLPELIPSNEDSNSCSEETIQSRESSTTEVETKSQQETNTLSQSLQVDKRRSRSKSPMRLPTEENLSKGVEQRRSKLIERTDELVKQLEKRSLTPETPTVVVEYVYEIESSEQTETTLFSNAEDDCTREQMDLLVQSLREARSKTRSKTPMLMKNVKNINEVKMFHDFQRAEYVETSQYLDTTNVPTISVNFSEAESNQPTSMKMAQNEDEINLLVKSLRADRSRSSSKSRLLMHDSELIHNRTERATTPEPSAISRIEFMADRSRNSRSKSPSRSHSKSPSPTDKYRSYTPSRSLSPLTGEYDDFHLLLNLEASNIKTLSISSEEQESLQLANRQRQFDEEALEKLRNASEEMELRTLSPLILDREELSEQQSQDNISEFPSKERIKFLKKTPTSPDYERTISEEVRDNERIKQERLKKGFKRSTYVGESMDLGSEFEPLRKEAAKFQRSRRPSPTFSRTENCPAQINAEEKRIIQDSILHELTTSVTVPHKEYISTGAIPKTDHLSSSEELSEKKEIRESTSVNEECSSIYSDAATESVEEMRLRNAEFRRSASASRSPLLEAQKEKVKNIEIEAAKRTLEDKLFDEISGNSLKFQDFSRCLSTDYFDNDRRASDSALMQVPDILVNLKDDEGMEPDEYHHYRRFSLAQEEPQEQYSGDDYICIQQVEVRTRSGSRTWLKEDFYSDSVQDFLQRGEKSTNNSVEREIIETSANIEQQENAIEEAAENIAEEAAAAAVDEDEDYSNGSDDDRQTVVEVDDEIDEDISDFNERGPAEESHHEISECEEAEREVDRYAGREASDWNREVNESDHANQMIDFEEDEGAVGGFSSSSYDSDSFAIDQIYDEAIKNRKQSGILREYDSILRQMSSSSDMDEQYLLWSKTNSQKNPKNIEFNAHLLVNERNESAMRYLGDANTTARQSARLHSRYGYKPILQAKSLEDDITVDLNYKPKREYKWRKNFKLDDDTINEDKEITLEELYAQEGNFQNKVGTAIEKQWEETNNNEAANSIGAHKFSLGEESVTLENFSLVEESCEADRDLNNEIFLKENVQEAAQESFEKPKKKKTKKKSHKESKASLKENMNKEDEEAYDNQVYSRRSSSIQMDTDSPKLKSRSRRSSKSSLTKEDSLRSSVGCNESIGYIMEEFTDAIKENTRPKKMKKRKKVKETIANVAEIPIDNRREEFSEVPNNIPPVSSVVTPESSSANILSTLSPQNSVCVTPASIESETNLSFEELRETTANSSATTDSSPSGNLSRTSSLTAATPVDTFDILKDANFYPLF